MAFPEAGTNKKMSTKFSSINKYVVVGLRELARRTLINSQNTRWWKLTSVSLGVYLLCVYFDFYSAVPTEMGAGGSPVWAKERSLPGKCVTLWTCRQLCNFVPSFGLLCGFQFSETTFIEKNHCKRRYLLCMYKQMLHNKKQQINITEY